MLVTILSFIVVIGIVITIHEFGHFAMAKLLKIRVLVFSIGFGPRLVGFTRGGTEYRISPIPLGGYVKMAGETFDEDREGTPDEFLSHPKWHRFLVAIAGPLMNILLAVGIWTFAYMEGIHVARYQKEPAVIGPVVADSIASRSGFQTGDRILSVAGNPVVTWEDMEVALATAPKDSLVVVVERGSERLSLRIDPPEGNVDSGSLGLKFSIPRTIVYAVDPESPAHDAGLQRGDEILSVQKGEIRGETYDEILNIISRSDGIPLEFEVFRPDRVQQGRTDWSLRETDKLPPGKMLRMTIAPREVNGRVLLGFVPEVPSDFRKFGLGGAFVQSVRYNYEMAGLTFRIIGRIIRGSASVKTISGPVEIAMISGSAARTRSASVFFGLLALISLQLGIFNLLPIPILDGGVIALLLVEGVIGRDLSLGIKEKIVQVGFVFLILLMGFVVFNDLSKYVDFEKLFR